MFFSEVMGEIDKIKKILIDHEKRIKFLEGKKSSKIFSKPTKTTSIMSLLMGLKVDGFFDKPRYLKDIVAELARRGYHFMPSSLTEPLRRALRNKVLGRIGKSGKWQYVRRG